MSAMPRPARNHDLHGNAPDEARVALVLIDVINDLDFPGGAALLRPARTMARRLGALKRRARRLGIPAIYVNDNFGRWRSDFATLVAHCRRPGARGRDLAELLAPSADDYFVLKPKHSGFFATPLDTLLLYLGVETLILTGLTTDRCVLFTAADAHVRDYQLFVPRDCVAAIDSAAHRQALRHLERVVGVLTTPSSALDLPALLGRRRASAKTSTIASGRRVA
jgi:nicotinamidase-related amidase